MAQQVCPRRQSVNGRLIMWTRGGVEAGVGAEAGQELRSSGAVLKTSRRDVELWGGRSPMSLIAASSGTF